MSGVDVDVALGVVNAWLAGAQGPGNIVVGIALLSVDLLMLGGWGSVTLVLHIATALLVHPWRNLRRLLNQRVHACLHAVPSGRPIPCETRALCWWRSSASSRKKGVVSATVGSVRCACFCVGSLPLYTSSCCSVNRDENRTYRIIFG